MKAMRMIVLGAALNTLGLGSSAALDLEQNRPNPFNSQTTISFTLDEAQIPVAPDGAAACEILGLDPLNTANEGKLIAICPSAKADALLAIMRAHPLGQNAAIIGNVTDDPSHLVQMKTAFGGTRIVDWLAGEQLPRIC